MTDTFNWRWVFFINIPFGILAVILSILFLPDLQASRRITKLDWLGILWLTVFLGCFQTFLEQGNEYDWWHAAAAGRTCLGFYDAGARIPDRRPDARLIIGSGAVLTAVCMWMLASINPSTSEQSLFFPLLLRGIAFYIYLIVMCVHFPCAFGGSAIKLSRITAANSR